MYRVYTIEQRTGKVTIGVALPQARKCDSARARNADSEDSKRNLERICRRTNRWIPTKHDHLCGWHRIKWIFFFLSLFLEKRVECEYRVQWLAWNTIYNYNSVKRGRAVINLELVKFEAFFLKRYIVHFTLKRFYITQQMAKWRRFSSCEETNRVRRVQSLEVDGWLF